MTFPYRRDIISKQSRDSKQLGGIAQLGERLNGIQEVSGSIPLISTIEALKTIGFQGFLLFCGTFILPGTFLTRVLTRITKCPKNPICFKRSAVRFCRTAFVCLGATIVVYLICYRCGSAMEGGRQGL